MCFVISHFQIYVISLAEPRLPLQLDDAIRPEIEGEEVKIILLQHCFLCMFSLQNIKKLDALLLYEEYLMI